MKGELAADAGRSIPPLAVTGMTILGYPMSDWVLLLTALYTVMQIAVLVRRFAFARSCAVKDCPARSEKG